MARDPGVSDPSRRLGWLKIRPRKIPISPQLLPPVHGRFRPRASTFCFSLRSWAWSSSDSSWSTAPLSFMRRSVREMASRSSRNSFFFGLGMGTLLAVCRIDYRKWSKWAYPVLGVAVALLLAVFIPGLARAGGAQRWIHLGPDRFPARGVRQVRGHILRRASARSEKRAHSYFRRRSSLARSDSVPCVSAFASSAGLRDDRDDHVRDLHADVSLQVFLRNICSLPWPSPLSAGVVLAMGTAYRRDRVMTFLDPWRDPSGKGFQILQSMLGLHNGSLFGVGLGNGKENCFIFLRPITISSSP